MIQIFFKLCKREKHEATLIRELTGGGNITPRALVCFENLCSNIFFMNEHKSNRYILILMFKNSHWAQCLEGSHFKRKTLFKVAFFPLVTYSDKQILLSEKCHRSRWVHIGSHPLSNLINTYISFSLTIHYYKIKHYTTILCIFQNGALSIFYILYYFSFRVL